MIITIANPKQFTNKNKSITCIKVFVKLYNLQNHKQVHKIYRIIELEKMSTSTAKYFRNFGTCYIVKIFLILRYAYIFLKIRSELYFMSITILTRINLTNSILLIG